MYGIFKNFLFVFKIMSFNKKITVKYKKVTVPVTILF